MSDTAQLHAENLALKEELAVLRAQIEWLKKKLFGGGQGERLDRAQLLLKLGALEALAATPTTSTVTYERARPTSEPRPVPAATSGSSGSVIGTLVLRRTICSRFPVQSMSSKRSCNTSAAPSP